MVVRQPKNLVMNQIAAKVDQQAGSAVLIALWM